MAQQLGKIIISFLISNWIYCEAVLIYPPLDPFFRNMVETFKIPTHDQWGDIASSPRAKAMRASVESSLESSLLRDGFVAIGVLDNDVRQLLRGEGKRGKGYGDFIRMEPLVFDYSHGDRALLDAGYHYLRF